VRSGLGQGVDGADEYGGVVDEFIASGRANDKGNKGAMLYRSHTYSKKTRLGTGNLLTDWGGRKRKKEKRR